jgi:hypothetical protein
MQALEADMRAWIENWNQHLRPFTWTKTAEDVLDSLEKCMPYMRPAHQPSVWVLGLLDLRHYSAVAKIAWKTR